MKTEDYCSLYHLSIFPFLFIFMNGVMSSVFLFSCLSSVENPLLLSADSLMETRPDSALIILESITTPKNLSYADRALYALLLTQARHKNYITLEDDSLIKTAVAYYGDKKKELYAAKAHYYWGATYRDMGYNSFAVEEYLVAIRLMPIKNEFLAMIYDNLAKCYEEEYLNYVAIEAYQKSCQILEGKDEQAYPLRGIGGVFFSQNEKDSALHYYQQSLDCALKMKNNDLIGALYHDFAMVYNEEKDYVKAYDFISKAIMLMGENATNAYLLKAKIMLNLNELDSASYFFHKNINQLDIYGRAVCYDGMCQIAKKRGEWKIATEHMERYKILYDSIQLMSDNKELNQLMDKHRLEEHKRKLSEHTKISVLSLVAVFVFLMIACVFYFMWNDRKRKKHYIALQQELTQKRVDTMKLKEEEASVSNKEDINRKRLGLIEEQLQLCVTVLKSSDCYNKMETLEKTNPKQWMTMRSLRVEIRSDIMNDIFVDLVWGLKEYCPALTNDDIYYCILSLLYCSKNVIMELMDTTSDALKTRKNRIKNKISIVLFERIFISDNQ